MKFEILVTLALSLLIAPNSFATSDVEPAGAPAIRLVRAAIPAFAKTPSVFKQQLQEWGEKATDAEAAAAAKEQANELNGMLDQIKVARSNPVHGLSTSITTSFADGSFGIAIATSNVDRSDTTLDKVVCKALKSSNSKTAYECEVEFSWGGEYESLMSYKLQFARDSKTGVITPRKITRIMAG